MTILYFTSTGNSLYAARQIGGTLVSIPQAIRRGQFSFEDEAIGLVFPVYGLCVPPLVLDFLSRAELKTEYLFAVATYGFYDGDAVGQLKRAAARRGERFSYCAVWKTVENYLPGFDMKKEKRKAAGAQAALDAVCQDIHGRKIRSGDGSALDRFMTWTHKKHYAYPCGIGVTEQLHVTTNCRGCGVCAQVCPMDNIHLEGGKPVFSHQCISCLACTQNCPQNAIRLQSEKSRARYRNPAVALEDLIDAVLFYCRLQITGEAFRRLAVAEEFAFGLDMLLQQFRIRCLHAEHEIP